MCWTLHVSSAPRRQGSLVEPKPRQTTGGSRRGAQLGGVAGPGRTGRRQSSSPRQQAPIVTPKESKTRPLNEIAEARTSELLFKPTGEHNDQLTAG